MVFAVVWFDVMDNEKCKRGLLVSSICSMDILLLA